jgi:hypothetical protein
MLTNEDNDLLQYLMGEDVFTDAKAMEAYAYMSNPDGTMRWVYSQQLKKPTFLNFYSTASLRAKMLSTLIRLAFFVKQSQRVASGNLKLNISKNSRLAKVLDVYPHEGFSIFTGTVGENRKVVIELHDKKEIFVFAKIALTEAAKILVHNEAKCLTYLNTLTLHTMTVPKLLSYNEVDTIGLSNIKPKNFHQDTTLTILHVTALSELYASSHREEKWNELKALDESKQKLTMLLDDFEEVNDLGKHRIQALANKIVLLMNILEENNDDVTVAMSHGDFTPWNMYSSNSVLHLFDWELSQDAMPLMFDLFHFVFQSEIMIKKTTYTEISDVLDKLVGMESTQKLMRDYSVDANKNYIFYLISNVTYYLNKYSKQKDLHEQVFWLIDVWENAIDDSIKKQGIIFK